MPQLLVRSENNLPPIDQINFLKSDKEKIPLLLSALIRAVFRTKKTISINQILGCL